MFNIIVGVYFFMNVWLAFHFWQVFRSHPPLAAGGALVIMVLAISWIAGHWWLSDSRFGGLAITVGSIWICLFLYLFLLTLGWDLLLLLNRVFRIGPPLRNAGFYGLLFSTGGAILICAAGWWNAQHPIARSIDLRDGSPESLRLAVITDVHLGRMVSAAHLEKLVDLTLPYQPDLVILAGDTLDDYIGLDLPAMTAAFDRLRPPLGLWAALGNHEYIAGDADLSVDILRSAGLNVLRDAWSAPGGRLLLVGRDDYSNRGRQSLPDIMATVPDEQRRLPLVLIDHQPYNLSEAAAAGARLEVSGHTHNGQLWPFNYLIDRIFELPWGHMKKGGTDYLVSAGAGTWGPPVRTSSRSEVLIVDLPLRN